MGKIDTPAMQAKSWCGRRRCARLAQFRSKRGETR